MTGKTGGIYYPILLPEACPRLLGKMKTCTNVRREWGNHKVRGNMGGSQNRNLRDFVIWQVRCSPGFWDQDREPLRQTQTHTLTLSCRIWLNGWQPSNGERCLSLKIRESGRKRSEEDGLRGLEGGHRMGQVYIEHQ